MNPETQASHQERSKQEIAEHNAKVLELFDQVNDLFQTRDVPQISSGR
jgi:hypothetical protein